MLAFVSAVADIQILGSFEEISAIVKYLCSNVARDGAVIDDVLRLLYKVLRWELGLQPAEGKPIIFHFCRQVMTIDERMTLLFSYGTLQQENVQLSSFGRLLKGDDDTMPGYRQSMLEITDPDVVAKSGKRFHPVVEASPDSADSVAGKVFEITEAELAAADMYEVADYKRINVRLGSGKVTWVYIKA